MYSEKRSIDSQEPQADAESIVAAWVGAYLWVKYGSVGAPDIGRFREALNEFERWRNASPKAHTIARTLLN